MVTPKKGFSEEKTKERSLFRRIIEWVPLVGTALFYSRPYTKFERDHKEFSGLKQLYHSASVVSFGAYIYFGMNTGNWTLEQCKKNVNERMQKNYKVDSTYNSIVKENVDDTTFVRLLKDYIPFSEKEKVVKQNSLENKTQE